MSGVPEAAMGADLTYGENEVFLLPRGAFGRTPATSQVDLHVAARRALRDDITAELYADVFDVLDSRTVASVDNTYATQFSSAGRSQQANAISGGSYDDLLWAKSLDINGSPTHIPLGRNPDFHKPTAFYAATYARIGFRLTF